MQRIRALARGRLAVWLVVLAELFFLLWGFARRRQLAEPVTLLSDSFSAFADGVEAGPEGIAVPAGLSGDVLTSRWVELPAGIYNVTVAYTGGGSSEIYFYDYENVYSGAVPLTREHDAVTFQAYVAAPGAKQATLRVRTDGSPITVHSVVLQPSHAYGWYWLLCAASLCAAADLVWLVWSGRLKLPGSAGAQTAALGVGAVALLATLPLLIGNLTQGHDLMFHLVRMQGLLEGLQGGQLPVRIQPFWLQGRGYAVSVFYGDLLLYPAALLRLLGVSVQGAYKCYVAAVNLATAAVSYYCLHIMLRDRWAALTGCALYTLSAYRLTTLYVRAGVGEYTALIFLPLIVYGLWRIFTLPDGAAPPPLVWLPAALGYSGVLQSHVLSCEMVGVLTAAVCLVLLRRLLRPAVLLSLCRAAVAAVVLNLWFLLPFLEFFGGSYKFSDPGFQRGIQNSGVLLGQLFGLLFSGATNFYNQSVTSGAAGEMPLGIGLVPLCGVLLFVLCTLRGADRSSPAWRLGNFCLWCGAACLVLSTPLFPWDTLSAWKPLAARLVNTLQYVWRFLGPATAFWVITGACALALCRGRAELHRMAVLGLAVLTLTAWGFFAESYARENHALFYYSAAALNSNRVMTAEYLPLDAQEELLTGRREVRAGPGVTLGETEMDGLRVTVQCESEGGGTVTVPVVNYPYYRAVDSTGAALPVGQAESGELTVTVPAGYAGSFTVGWQEPWHWRLAEAVSLSGAAALALYAWRQRKKRRGPAGAAATGRVSAL